MGRPTYMDEAARKQKRRKAPVIPDSSDDEDDDLPPVSQPPSTGPSTGPDNVLSSPSTGSSTGSSTGPSTGLKRALPVDRIETVGKRELSLKRKKTQETQTATDDRRYAEWLKAREEKEQYKKCAAEIAKDLDVPIERAQKSLLKHCFGYAEPASPKGEVSMLVSFTEFCHLLDARDAIPPEPSHTEWTVTANGIQLPTVLPASLPRPNPFGEKPGAVKRFSIKPRPGDEGEKVKWNEYPAVNPFLDE